MKSYGLFLSAPALLVCAFAAHVHACDLHAVSTSLDQRAPEANTFHLEVTEQFSELRRIQQNGTYVRNEQHEGVSSSQTLFIAAYDFNDRWTVEASIPYFNRRYSRIVANEITRGTEAGFGDLTLRALAIPYRDNEPGRRKLVQVFAGLKLPTGNSDPLGEGHAEENSEEPRMTRHAGHHHHALPSAVHGHDIALGSGSVDFPFGAAFYVERDAFSLDGRIEYTIRTEGDHSYRHANDLRWIVGSGVSFATSENSTLTAKLNLSGEYKGKDRVHGEDDDATSILAWYMGPEVALTMHKRVAGFIAYDIPLNIENSGYQAVTDYRIRSGLSVRF